MPLCDPHLEGVGREKLCRSFLPRLMHSKPRRGLSLSTAWAPLTAGLRGGRPEAPMLEVRRIPGARGWLLVLLAAHARVLVVAADLHQSDSLEQLCIHYCSALQEQEEKTVTAAPEPGRSIATAYENPAWLSRC